jgi:hypothetical protein
MGEFFKSFAERGGELFSVVQEGCLRFANDCTSAGKPVEIVGQFADDFDPSIAVAKVSSWPIETSIEGGRYTLTVSLGIIS